MLHKAGRVAQVIECLPSEREALNSNPSTAKKQNKKKSQDAAQGMLPHSTMAVQMGSCKRSEVMYMYQCGSRLTALLWWKGQSWLEGVAPEVWPHPPSDINQEKPHLCGGN
jgi:hypothetical protein